mmetsp:Transcript_70992/g.154263  ORF Transcript_70992/g.154263 Transcript_70992/m.154263 type:complete len:415 (-) Transcript_70992:86-1330(-)
MAVPVESSILADKISARWRLRGISRFSTKRDERLDSGELLELQGAKFGLRLFWGGEQASSQDGSECSLFAYVLDGYPESLWWKPQLRIVHQRAGSDFVWEAPEAVVDKHDWGTAKFRKRCEILGGPYVVDDTLILELRVEAWLGKVKTKRLGMVAAPAPSASSNSSALACDFGELLRRGEGSDVTLKAEASGDGSDMPTFSAHRAVLSARSPVFRRMFYGAGMQEACPGSMVTLSDMDSKVAGWFLEFLYTDRIDSEAWGDDEALCHLLAAAHKYEVAQLVTRCELQVAARLSEENAAERLMMADLLGISGLRCAVLDYICSSHERLARVQGTDGFSRLGQQRPRLALEIVAKVVPPVARKRSAQAMQEDELPPNLFSSSIAQLKMLCGARGLGTSGNKEALIKRLREHAVNNL